MKRIVLWGVGLVAIVGLAVVGQFAWQNLRGAAPAFFTAPKDIGALIRSSLSPLTVPAGFSLSVFAKGLGAPRDLFIGPSGELLVSIPKEGRVVAVRDTDGDGLADRTSLVAGGLNGPHGLTMRCRSENACDLYIAEADKVSVFDYGPGDREATNKRTLITVPHSPRDRHQTRSLDIWSDGPGGEERLLVSIGSSCDVCEESDSRYASVMSYRLDGTDARPFATGLRNAVFMTRHPVTGDVWATEMGRDLLGDDLPPDEINILRPGKNYGWPICYGKNIHDTVFDTKTYIADPCAAPRATPSHIDIPAHSAPLGLAFVPEEGWPEDWWHNLIVAYHGSWNRTAPTGYKLVRFVLTPQGEFKGVEDFITGWLPSGTKAEGALGRPADVLILPGGTMYISDDKAGVIYRVVRTEKIAPAPTDFRDLISVLTPSPGDEVRSPLIVKGRARGFWFFEGSFPIELHDGTGEVIARGIASSKSDWMTEELIDFEAELTFDLPASRAPGELILRRDNPSDLRRNDQSVVIPVRFPGGARAQGECRPAGCSGQLCTDTSADTITTCEYRAEYACYTTARCERQANGQCGWTTTTELTRCLDNPPPLE